MHICMFAWISNAHSCMFAHITTLASCLGLHAANYIDLFNSSIGC